MISIFHTFQLCFRCIQVHIGRTRVQASILLTHKSSSQKSLLCKFPLFSMQKTEFIFQLLFLPIEKLCLYDETFLVILSLQDAAVFITPFVWEALKCGNNA